MLYAARRFPRRCSPMGEIILITPTVVVLDEAPN